MSEEHTPVVIGLFDPAQEPFGPLSNNYRMQLSINGVSYPTLSHYIFSQLVRTPAHRAQLRRHADYQTLETAAFQLMFDEMKHVRNLSLQVGLLMRFRQPYFRDALIATGDAFLEYRDQNNSELGVGASGKGLNLVGLWLMQLRSALMQ